MTEADRQVGIIGIGLVGTALVERLAAAGYRVTGYDVRPAQMEAVREMGAETECCAALVADR